MAAYKVCKAVAAALMDVAQTEEAVEKQALLQPLKFQHFEKRALHMAQQVRKICKRYEVFVSVLSPNVLAAALLSQPWDAAVMVGGSYRTSHPAELCCVHCTHICLWHGETSTTCIDTLLCMQR